MREMRKLTSKDLFKVTTILNKIGISEIKNVFASKELKETLSKDMADKTNSEAIASLVGINVVMDIAGIIISNLDKAEKEIYGFVASVINMTPKEVEEMPMTEFMETVIAIIRKEDFKDFFHLVTSSLK